MSKKLPVGETINEAFQFGLHRWGAVLRFGWLPFLASIAVMFTAVFAMLDFTAIPQGEQQLESIDEVRNIFRFPISIVVVVGLAAYALMFFLISGAFASVYRLAALGEERPGFFHFRTDGPAVRVFFAFAILTAINTVLWGLALTAALSMTNSSWREFIDAFVQFFQISAATESGDVDSREVMQALMAPFKVIWLSLLIAAIPLIYVNVKLVPFAPGSAAENRLLLFGSFAMTTGHFWSIVGVWLLYFLLMIVISIIFQLVIMIINMLMMFLIGQGSALAIAGVILLVAYIGGSIWFNSFVYALQLGLQAIIYRRLKTSA